MFLTIFYILRCVCLIFHIFQFSPHNPDLQCIFHIFHIIQCFSPYSSYTMFVTLFPRVFLFVCFFTTFQDLTGCISHFSCFSMFLFHISCSKVCVSQFPRFSIFSPNSNPKVSISHFSHSSLFFAKFQVLQCVFLIVKSFECFSPYSRSSSVYLLFFRFFIVSRHIL